MHIIDIKELLLLKSRLTNINFRYSEGITSVSISPDDLQIFKKLIDKELEMRKSNPTCYEWVIND